MDTSLAFSSSILPYFMKKWEGTETNKESQKVLLFALFYCFFNSFPNFLYRSKFCLFLFWGEYSASLMARVVQGYGSEPYQYQLGWSYCAMITFSLSPRRWSFLPRMAASVRTFELFSWKEALLRNYLFSSEALVIHARTGRPVAGTPPAIRHRGICKVGDVHEYP